MSESHSHAHGWLLVTKPVLGLDRILTGSNADFHSAVGTAHSLKKFRRTFDLPIEPNNHPNRIDIHTQTTNLGLRWRPIRWQELTQSTGQN